MKEKKQKMDVEVDEKEEKDTNNAEEREDEMKADAEPVDAVDEESEEQEADSSEVQHAQVEQLQEQNLRLRADFENYRRRMERERQGIIQRANERLINQLLEVVDNFERALQSEKEKDAFYDGMQMIYQRLREVLEKEGLMPIEEVDVPFDPSIHNAVLMEEQEGAPSGTVLAILQTGYQWQGHVLRPAMVKVAK